MNSSLSIFARALATENLSFSFDPTAETASFDVKQRHLVMPVWNVSETVQTMLIAHEISHALWTPYEQSEAILDAAEKQGYDKTLLQRIANVVEDVRIEKLMKDKYPGTRRDFFLGYKEIVDRDMFSFSKMDIPNATIINRLNLHFKWGVPGFLDVPFSREEQQIVDEVDAVVTFEEVYEVAKRLYDHPSMQGVREQMEKQKGQQPDNGKMHKGDGAADFAEFTNGGKKDGEEYSHPTLTISPIKEMDKAILSTEFLLSEFEKSNEGRPLNLDNYRKFVKDSDAFVRQLASQFDRRKAADEIRRERPKQTGMLNLDRLHQYRTHDDIFISKIVKQDGKNHGIVFLLDFSGSMGHRLSDTLLQVIQLVWFCEKVKIPFEVFSFTDVNARAIHGHDQYEKMFKELQKQGMEYDAVVEFLHNLPSQNPKPTSVRYEDTRLVNLASSRDSAGKRERLLAYIYESLIVDERSVMYPGCLHLHGTPTVEAVAIASQFMQDWVQQQNIQIPTFMLVTDGQANGVSIENHKMADSFYYLKDGSTITVVNEIYGTAYRFNMKDYFGQCVSNIAIAGMMESMRTKLNARIVGMYVAGHNLHSNEFINFCLSNEERRELQTSTRGIEWDGSQRQKAAEQGYKDGAIVCHPDAYPGFDSFFICKTPKIVKDADAIADSGTFTKIKNTFVKTMAKRSVSRVFLTRYVDIVAGQKIPNPNTGQNALPWKVGAN
jgi:hypothetical protein